MKNAGALIRNRRRLRFSLAGFLLLMFPLGFGFLCLRHYLDSRPIEWVPYSPGIVSENRIAGKTVLLNFTARWSFSNLYNEKYILETPPVRRAIRSGNIVAMRADWTNDSPEIRAALKSLGQNGIPVVAVYPALPSKPIVLTNVITENQVLTALAKATAEPKREMRTLNK